MELKDKILVLRKAKGYSQQELGDRLSKSTFGISRQAVSDWENGKSIPKLDNLRDFARALNISFDALLDDKCDLNDSKTLADVLSGRYKKDDTNPSPYLSMDIYAYKRLPKVLAFILIFVFISMAFVIGFYIFKDVQLSVDSDSATIMGKLDALLASLELTNAIIKKVYMYAICVSGLLPFIFVSGVLYTKIPSKKMIGHFDAHALTINQGHISYYARNKIVDIYTGKQKGLDKVLIILTDDGKQMVLDHIVEPESLVNAFQDLKHF